MTVSDALRAATLRLTETSDTARMDVELLMAHALGISRSDMLLRAMQNETPASFAPLVERRSKHEPVAYILGHADFFGRRFLVNSDVLIPRGDSETVVAAALDVAPEKGRVLDLGTGSGALLLTLLAERPELEGVGIDASLGALAIAAANAAQLGVQDRVRMLHCDWREAGWADEIGRFELVIANPPYVETGAELAPDVREFEPASALFAGEDGLAEYCIIAPQLRGLLTETGTAVLEIGAGQADAVTQISEKEGFTVILRYDLAGRPRGLILQ